MSTTALSESEIVDGLRVALPRLVPEAQVLSFKKEVLVGGVSIDLQAKVRIGKIVKTLLGVVKAKGEPRYVYEALGQLSLAAKARPDAYPVLIVPAISKEGKQLCKQAGVGYLTLTSELSLKFDTVYIERVTQTAQESAAGGLPRSLLRRSGIPQRVRQQPFPFSSKASRVLRAFLEAPKESWTVAALAAEARVAPRLALLAVNALVDKLVVKKERGAITLTKPKKLLSLWTNQYEVKKANQILGYYSMERTFEEFLKKLRSLPAAYQTRYALTLYGGAALVAPYLRFAENYLYIQGKPQEWADLLGMKPVDSGANSFLILPYDPSVFYKVRKVKGVSVVSDLQLYLDLYNFNDRAREQAETLYQQTLNYA